MQLVAEDDVFDQHALDLDAPSGRDFFDDFANRLRYFFAALDDVLKNAGADDVPERGLRALDERLADVGNAKSSFVGRDDVVVDYGSEM